jgi:hypothetical protein
MRVVSDRDVVAGFSPRFAFANHHCVREQTRAEARDYIEADYTENLFSAARAA